MGTAYRFAFHTISVYVLGVREHGSLSGVCELNDLNVWLIMVHSESVLNYHRLLPLNHPSYPLLREWNLSQGFSRSIITPGMTAALLVFGHYIPFHSIISVVDKAPTVISCRLGTAFNKV